MAKDCCLLARTRASSSCGTGPGSRSPGRAWGRCCSMVLLGTAPALLPRLRWRLGPRQSPCCSPARSRSTSRGLVDRDARGRAARGFLDFYDSSSRSTRRRTRDARRRPPRGLLFTRSPRWRSPRGVRSRRRSFSSSAQAGPRRSCPATTTSAAAHSSSSPPSRSSPGSGRKRDAPLPRSSSGWASSSSRSSFSLGAIAKSQFVEWENWDFYNKPGKPVNVEYIWKANYDGIDFPKERTRVFTVQAPARARLLAGDDARRLHGRPLGRGSVRSIRPGPVEPGPAHG